MTEKHLTNQKFIDLSLTDSLNQGVQDAGFEFCTPIQAQALPIALTGQDVAGQAQTGTGKTVAFLLACAHYLEHHPATVEQPGRIRGLILAPTRELAIQINRDAETLLNHTGLRLGLVYGGTGYDEQKQHLAAGVDILIGTPGRLIDFYKQRLFDLKYLQVVVLDEADRMFDLGFIRDIRYLFRRMPAPPNRLSMLFSATLSFRVMELAYEHMNNPAEITIESASRVADGIEEFCFYPADDEKTTLLVNLLKRAAVKRALVFVNTRHAVETVAADLVANGISSAALSGDVPQKKRERLLQEFKDGEKNALVATDVAARGLHIPAVSHVYNYDLPQDAEDYVHRIGRTARAGASGVAISFLCEKYAYSIVDIETYVDHNIEKRPIEPWMLEAIEIGKRQRRERRHGAKSRNGTKSDRPQKDAKPARPQKDAKPARSQKEAKPARPPSRPKPKPDATTQSIRPRPVATGTMAAKDYPADPLPINQVSRKFGQIPMLG